MTIDHPLLTILVGVGLDECWVRPSHLRFGHGETRGGAAFAQGFEVLLCLCFCRPVRQRVHIALVRSLAVENPRAVVVLGRFGLNYCQFYVTQTHTAPLIAHVRQPQPLGSGSLSQGDQPCDVGLLIRSLERLDLRFSWSDSSFDKRSDLLAKRLYLRGKGEVDCHLPNLLRGSAPLAIFSVDEEHLAGGLAPFEHAVGLGCLVHGHSGAYANVEVTIGDHAEDLSASMQQVVAGFDVVEK